MGASLLITLREGLEAALIISIILAFLARLGAFLARLGSFLKALFGYNGNPELLEVLFYFAYLGAVLWTCFRHTREPGVASRPRAQQPRS